MNALQQERFSRLQFPVHKITAKTPAELFEVLPGLRRYFQNIQNFPKSDIEVQFYDKKEDKTYKNKVEGYPAMYRGLLPEDLTKIIKYIVFVYDPDSDLIQEYHDEPKILKEAAAKEAGFHRLKDGNWPQDVQDIIDFKNKQVVDWIIDYMKVRKNPIFTEIKFIDEELQALYEARARALVKGEVEGKSNLMSLIKQRLEERDSLYKRFYAEHTELKNLTQDELYPVSPENIFKELKIPPEKAKVRQVKDVSKNAGLQEAHN